MRFLLDLAIASERFKVLVAAESGTQAVEIALESKLVQRRVVRIRSESEDAYAAVCVKKIVEYVCRGVPHPGKRTGIDIVVNHGKSDLQQEVGSVPGRSNGPSVLVEVGTWRTGCCTGFPKRGTGPKVRSFVAAKRSSE